MPGKKLPKLTTDREAEDFVASADLTDYDLSGFRPVRFEYEAKDAKVNMRLPESLLAAVKQRASILGIPYQRFIRDALERAVTSPISTKPR